MKKYFEYNDQYSHKFWQIEVEANTFTTTYGPIGADGKSTKKEFNSKEKAQKEAEKIIKKKEKKGYKLTQKKEAEPEPETIYTSNEEIFQDLKNKQIDVRRHALLAFSKVYDGQKINLKDQNIWLSGSLELYKINEVKTKLEKINSKLTSKKTANTTLLVIGLKTKLNDLPNDIPAISGFLFEKLVQGIESTDLADAEDEQIEKKIINLLFSSDMANVKLAMDLMKQGGIPDALLSLVFGFYKVHPNKNVRAYSSKLLKLRGGEIGKKLIKLYGRRVFLSMYYESAMGALYCDFIPKEEINTLSAIDGFDIAPFGYCMAKYLGVATYTFTGIEAEWAERYVDEKLLDKTEIIIFSQPSSAFKKIKGLKKIRIQKVAGTIDLSVLWQIPTLEEIKIDHSEANFLIPKEASNLTNLKRISIAGNEITLEASLNVEEFEIECNKLTVKDNFNLTAKKVTVTSNEANIAVYQPFFSPKTEVLSIQAHKIQLGNESTNQTKIFNLTTNYLVVNTSKQLFSELEELNLFVKKENVNNIKLFLNPNLKKINIKSNKDIVLDDSINGYKFSIVNIISSKFIVVADHISTQFDELNIKAKSVKLDKRRQIFHGIVKLNLTLKNSIQILKPFLSNTLKVLTLASPIGIVIDNSFNPFHLLHLDLISNNVKFTGDITLNIDHAIIKANLVCPNPINSIIKRLEINSLDKNLISNTIDNIILNVPENKELMIPIDSLPQLNSLELRCFDYRRSLVRFTGEGNLNVDYLIIQKMKLKFDESVIFKTTNLLINTQRNFILPIQTFPYLKTLDFEGLKRDSDLAIQGSGNYPITKLLLKDVKLLIDPEINLDALDELKLDNTEFDDAVKNKIYKNSLKRFTFSEWGRDFDFDLEKVPNLEELKLISVKKITTSRCLAKKLSIHFNKIDQILPENFPNLETLDIPSDCSSLKYFIPFKKLKAVYIQVSDPYANPYPYAGIQKLPAIEELKLYFSRYLYKKQTVFKLPLIQAPIKRLILQQIRIFVGDNAFDYFPILEELVIDKAYVSDMSVFKTSTLKTITIVNPPSINNPKNWLKDIKAMFANVEIVINEQKI